MNIGILTWFDVLNYGSAFQAYALQEVLRNQGFEVEILRHDRVLPDYYGNKIRGRRIKHYIEWLRNQTPRRIKYRIETKKKYDAFEQFRSNYLNVGSHYSNASDDIIIIGSDQIFDINGMYYPFQFGGGISSKIISTYVPSFGETTYKNLQLSENSHEIKENIKKLYSVNARDDNTKHILSIIRNEKIEVVLDPVLLYGFTDEKCKWNTRLIKEEYCIVYTWGGYTTGKKL